MLVAAFSPTITLVWGQLLPHPQSKWFFPWRGPGMIQILSPERLLPPRPNLTTNWPGVSICQFSEQNLRNHSKSWIGVIDVGTRPL